MKNTILLAVAITFVMVSCNQKNKQVETTNTPMMENDTTMPKDSKTKLYACPMHPEAQGKLNDKCPKCGMDLTEEVK
jgi:hypothetical protein